MRILISPAKKMRVGDDFPPHTALPSFLSEAETLRRTLQALSDVQLQKLWRCNDSIARQNLKRLRTMDLRRNLSPAIFSYDGIQYQHIAPNVLTDGQLAFLQERLRILSGFYGLLRPFDGVTPYRLEMQAKLAVEGSQDLYDFWRDKLAKQLASETGFLLNLASREYSGAVLPHLPQGMFVLTCTFGELANGRVIEKGTMCKIARGGMVRYLAEQSITDAEGVMEFHDYGYQFDRQRSTPNHYFFIKKEDTNHAGNRNQSARLYFAG